MEKWKNGKREQVKVKNKKVKKRSKKETEN